MAFKPEEQRSAEALEGYLTASLAYTSASWKPGPDPPDLDFTVIRPNGVQETWGVEVTGMVQYVEQYVGDNGKTVERRGFEPAVQQLCDQLNEEYKDKWKNGYRLFVTGPLDAKVFRTLKGRIVTFIDSGKTEATCLDEAEVIASVLTDMTTSPDSPANVNDPHVQWVIQQLAPQRQRVLIVVYPAASGISVATTVNWVDKLPQEGGFVGDVQASVAFAVNRILGVKLPILQNRVNGYDRKILLIWSDLSLAKSSEVATALHAYGLCSTDLDGVVFVDYGWKSLSFLVDFCQIA
jgi:hypothetical protein